MTATQVSDGAAPKLRERRAELRSIEAALAAARGDELQLLLLSGPAGVGKTALLRAAATVATESGFLVLEARGGELEQGFAFGIVGQLFAAVVRDAKERGSEDLLGGDAQFAELALAPAPGSPPRDADFALLNALYWLCGNLCEQSPVLLVVDDAHWADAASLRFLSFLARRGDGMALALALAARTGEPGVGADPFAELGLDRVDRIEPGLLSAAAVSGLVRERLWEGASDELCRACHEATRGNAFLVEQVIVGLRQSGKPLIEIAVGDLDGVAAEGISAGVMARIAPLGPAARALSEATAVLGTRAEPRHAAALARLAPDRAEHVADGLRRTGILAPGRVLEFVHPLIRTSIYDAIAVGERGAAHAFAADLLAAEDAEPGAVAAHLLEAPRHGESKAVALLQAAAAASLAQGTADRAVHYLRRALEEPPTPDLRPVVLFALGAAEAKANDPAAAGTLDRARLLATDPMLKRGILLSMAGVLIAAGRHDEVMDLVDEELDQLGDDEPGLTAIFETFALATTLAAPPDQLLSERTQRIRRAEIVEGLPPEIACMRLAVLARCELNCGGQASIAVDLANRALADGRLLREHLALSPLPFLALGALTWTGQLQRSERLHDDAIALAREGHLTRALATSFTGRAVARRQMGKLDDAEADVSLALRLDAELPMSLTEPVSRAVLCEIRLDRGDVAGAREAIAADLERYHGVVSSFRFLQAARARLHLALGEPDQALRELTELGDRRVDELGARAELAPHWPPLAVRALLAAQERGEARGLAEKDVSMARAFGAPAATSAALVGLGLCQDDRDQAIGLLEEAVGEAQRSESRVALLESLVELGGARRRAGHRAAAREPLRAAIDLADRTGAAAFGDRARDELRATGARPRRHRLSGPASLTASERRIAQLAAAGRTNREIAQALFVTMKTVEMHLSNAYRKLDIGSRGELNAALSEG